MVRTAHTATLFHTAHALVPPDSSLRPAPKKPTALRPSPTDGLRRRSLACISQVNFEMFKLMQEGQSALLMGNCAGVPPLIASIVNQMSIPLIQGSIRYAEICARTGDRALSNPEKAQAERTAFAAAIVPRIAACPAEKYPEAVADAEVLWTNLEHGAGVGDFPLVKKTFEKYYPCLNITCEMVGGFYDSFRKQYNEGAEPCVTVEANAQLLSNEAVVGVIAGTPPPIETATSARRASLCVCRSDELCLHAALALMVVGLSTSVGRWRCCPPRVPHRMLLRQAPRERGEEGQAHLHAPRRRWSASRRRVS